MAKIENDKYYTPIDLANYCWDKTLEIIGEENISEIIEPSEFDEKVEEFKDYLRQSIKEETQNEIEKLRKENESLQEIKHNWDSLVKEYENKKRELGYKIRECESKAASKRLETLFEETGMNVIMYKPDYNRVYGKKCSKCDGARYIHFSSPSGKDYKEDCECAKTFLKFYPRKFYLAEFRRNRDHSAKPMLFWFKKYEDYSDDYDGYTYDSSDVEKHVYESKDSYDALFEKYGQYSSGLYFKTEEDCQKYCDWLNEKSGVTGEMTKERMGW